MDTVTVVANLPLLPEFQTTAKRGKASRRTLRLPNILREFAQTNNGRVELTESNLAVLEQKGLAPNRLAVAAHGLRKFYGLSIKTERNGRKTSAYVIDIPATV